MKKGRYVLVIAIVFLAALLFLFQERDCMGEQRKPCGLFSWEEEVLLEENRQALFDLMEAYGLNEVYQHIPESTDREILGTFLQEAARREISVFLLCGDPSWSLDQAGKKIIYEVDRAAALNEQFKGAAGLAGVMLDVEPYLTEAWRDNPQWVMLRYVAAMKAAFQEAENAGLQSVTCIPYFYDTKGFTAELEELIAHGCHRIAVMNYYKGRELEHLQTELTLAEQYEKPVMTIYELQAPGKHELEDKNTYYHEGMEGVRQNWEALAGRTDSSGLTYGIHNYEALREVSLRE